jgi:DNA repair protein SbcC/Rad50
LIHAGNDQLVFERPLTQEPRDRNDAIDRLLGLSEYRNLLSGISGANSPGWQKEITSRFQTFENQVKTVLETWEKDLNEKRKEAVETGLSKARLTGTAALKTAHEAKQALESFAAEMGICEPSTHR